MANLAGRQIKAVMTVEFVDDFQCPSRFSDAHLANEYILDIFFHPCGVMRFVNAL